MVSGGGSWNAVERLAVVRREAKQALATGKKETDARRLLLKQRLR
jgi:hypothetical protein